MSYFKSDPHKSSWITHTSQQAKTQQIKSMFYIENIISDIKSKHYLLVFLHIFMSDVTFLTQIVGIFTQEKKIIFLEQKIRKFLYCANTPSLLRQRKRQSRRDFLVGV